MFNSASIDGGGIKECYIPSWQFRVSFTSIYDIRVACVIQYNNVMLPNVRLQPTTVNHRHCTITEYINCFSTPSVVYQESAF